MLPCPIVISDGHMSECVMSPLAVFPTAFSLSFLRTKEAEGISVRHLPATCPPVNSPSCRNRCCRSPQFLQANSEKYFWKSLRPSHSRTYFHFTIKYHTYIPLRDKEEIDIRNKEINKQGKKRNKRRIQAN